MDTVDRDSLKTTIEDLIEKVEEGESFIISHNDVPVAELRPYGGTVSGP